MVPYMIALLQYSQKKEKMKKELFKLGLELTTYYIVGYFYFSF